MPTDSGVRFFSLPNPRIAGSMVRYLLCSRKVLEIQACKSGPSSWFIDENVSSGKFAPLLFVYRITLLSFFRWIFVYCNTHRSVVLADTEIGSLTEKSLLKKWFFFSYELEH